MLDRANYVFRQKSGLLSAKDEYDILDADTDETLGSARQNTSTLMKLLGLALGKDSVPTAFEVRKAGEEAPAFTARRRGLLFKKVEAVDGQGQVIASIKPKRFSLSGGYHVYDGAGKHVAEAKGKLVGSEYRFLTPTGEEMAAVTKSWGGLARQLVTSAHTYGVRLSPRCADDPAARTVILAAALAIDTLFPKGEGKKKKDGDKGGGGGDD